MSGQDLLRQLIGGKYCEYYLHMENYVLDLRIVPQKRCIDCPILVVSKVIAWRVIHCKSFVPVENCHLSVHL